MPHDAIDAAGLSAREAYQLLTDLVAPRPIAWVSTQDEHGRRNLAPFSYYQAVCSAPPMVLFSSSWHGDGRPKDTLRNILATGTFVVNHVDRALAGAMNLTAGDFEAGVDEWTMVDAAGLGPLTPAASHAVAPPRVAQAKAALECRLVHALPLGHGVHGMPSTTLVVGEVVWFWLQAGLRTADAQGRPQAIDTAQLDSVGRLGGIAYTDTHGAFTMPRPPRPGTGKPPGTA